MEDDGARLAERPGPPSSPPSLRPRPADHAGDIGAAARSTSPSPIVELAQVGYEYPNGVRALDGLSLAVPAGEVVAVVGPSGCGKSTLLSLVAGLRQPTAGGVTLDVPGDERHPLSMLFQRDTLLPWLRVRDNVALYYRFNRRLASPRARERMDTLIDMVGLGEFARAFPNELSGGMRRRAGFLAAIVPNPHVMLLDEPFSSLDEPTRIAIHQDVHRIIREFGTTVVLVTHDLAEAITLADRVVVLTARPASVAAEVTVPFEGPREMLDLREDRSFLDLYGRLWHELREQLRQAPGRSDGAEGVAVDQERAGGG